MATTTSRIGLVKPSGTDLVDIAVLNSNSDKIDAVVGDIVCTSGTRPSSAWNGQAIFETDTGKRYVRVSSDWVEATISGAKVASGISAANVTTGKLPKAQLPSGSVLQVVTDTETAIVSVTSASFTTTNLSASITPQFSTSKILVIAHIAITNQSSASAGFVTLRKNGTSLGNGGNGMTQVYSAYGQIRSVQSFNFLDSPATTSSVTYDVAIRSDGTNLIYSCFNGELAHITLMEIAG